MKSVTQQGVWYQTIFPWRDMDFYIGSSLLLLLAGLAIFLLFHRKRPGAREFWILVVSSAFIIWLISHPEPWHMMGAAVGFIQTPFRLIEFPAIFLSVAAALGIGPSGWRNGGRDGASFWSRSSVSARIFSGCTDMPIPSRCMRGRDVRCCISRRGGQMNISPRRIRSMPQP